MIASLPTRLVVSSPPAPDQALMQSETLVESKIGPISFRAISLDDIDDFLAFQNALSKQSKIRFAPYRWDSGHYVEDIVAAVRRVERSEDRAFLVRYAGRVIAHCALWKVAAAQAESESGVAVTTIGTCVADHSQGKGVGPACVKFLKEQALTAGLDGIELTTMPENQPAISVAVRSGFFDVGFTHIPLGIEPTGIPASGHTAPEFRREKQFGFSLRQGLDAAVTQELLRRQAVARKQAGSSAV